MPTTYDLAELTDSLKKHIRPGTEGAAVGLLIEHDYWLRRIAYHHPQFVMVDAGIPYRLDWIELAKAAGRGELYASSSQTAILNIALSIQVFGAGVNLGDVLPGLDRTNTASVLRAIATAAGHPDLDAEAQKLRDANNRAWDVVKLLRLRSLRRGEDQYADPTGQMLSAALVNDESHGDVRREIEAVEQTAPGTTTDGSGQ
ncbi:hypothetical protein ACFVJK_30620 [Streptomyces sp. NPDC127172]|uniref:hypothetical protein n=1 Tax=Streptomyces sp. NPDC127172 TaxID=3345382 RepID=UPI00363533A0